ncbi:MAG: hypothetical protein FWD53_00865, partial [Phycisphaerales bacterium]|nr:hypothetical protein [Phycisphaerales bacterium]
MARNLWKEIALVGCVAATVGLMASCQQALAPEKVGIVSQLKVLSENTGKGYVCEDVSSPEAWKQTYIKKGMTDEEKAIAIWKTVVKYRHQDSPPSEKRQTGCVHDPIKTFNVYGYGMCCCAASNLQGLGRYIGMPAQGRMITQHSVSELWYDGAWHLFDPSLMNYFRNAQGKIASVNEINESIKQWRKDNPGIVENANGGWDGVKLKAFSKDGGWKKGPTVLATAEPGMYSETAPGGVNGAGWHGWWSTMQEYGKISQAENAFGYTPDGAGKKTIGVFDYGAQMGYKVNVQLREGEKITRNWSNKNLHVNMKGYGGAPGIMDPKRIGALKYQQTYLGDKSPGRVGNGVLEYDVPLETGAFRKGAFVAENLQSKSEGAASAVAVKDGAKDGVLEIRMPTSYNFMAGHIDVSPVVAAGGSVTVFFSQNHGMDWTEIAKFEQTGDQKVDISNNVFNRYDYRLKFVLKGAGTGLNGLKIVNDIQHSQAVMPLIFEGENKISFSAGQQEGTITFEGHMSDEKYLHVMNYHPKLDGLGKNNLAVLSGKGTAIFTMKTPGDITRFRMNAHYRARDYPAVYTDLKSDKLRDYYDIDVSFDA